MSEKYIVGAALDRAAIQCNNIHVSILQFHYLLDKLMNNTR